MRQVTITTTASAPNVPSPVTAASTARDVRAEKESSPGPSEEEEISYEEAKRRAEERAEAALQCSIDNKDACVMCSG
jgi:ribonucleoside-diphosphate reductase subunit M1